MLDVASLRQQFPALQQQRSGQTPIFLDGPAGTQVPRRCIDAITRYLTTCNANHAGLFATSIESDEILHRAHQGMADLLNAPSADEIIFGPNMTTLTFQLSRALACTWQPGDEIVVTRLDHDANVSPWALAARDAGATLRKVDIHPEDCTLDMDDLQATLSPRTKLVALTCASNLVGTMPDLQAAVRLVRQTPALVFLDAVHYTPHAPVDVQAWDCDFLACSAYKFFGPHLGILWGRRRHLESLPAYKVRPAADELPGKWMTGTQNHECLAGLTGTLDYLADLGSAHAAPSVAADSRRARFRAALSAIREYEQDLARSLLEGLAERPRYQVWGIADPGRCRERTPTVSVTHESLSPEQLASHLAASQIYCWSGNSYALEVTERLGLEDRGGVVRLGLVHYNTPEEIRLLLAALDAA